MKVLFGTKRTVTGHELDSKNYLVYEPDPMFVTHLHYMIMQEQCFLPNIPKKFQDLTRPDELNVTYKTQLKTTISMTSQ